MPALDGCRHAEVAVGYHAPARKDTAWRFAPGPERPAFTSRFIVKIRATGIEFCEGRPGHGSVTELACREQFESVSPHKTARRQLRRMEVDPETRDGKIPVIALPEKLKFEVPINKCRLCTLFQEPVL